MAASPEMQFDNMALGSSNSAQFGADHSQQIQHFGESHSPQSHIINSESSFSQGHRENSLQTLRNNFFESYDNKLIKR